MKKLIYIFALVVATSTDSLAWNHVGHRLIAQIAYNNMNSSSRKMFSEYNKILNVKGRKFSLIDSSFWLDTLYKDKYKDFRQLHYINLPLAFDNVKPREVNNYNAVFAVNMANLLLLDKDASVLDKSLAFRILWHVVGDLHQPLHAVSKYSKQFPAGDMGGNLVHLSKNKVASNLHSYWDRAGGALVRKKHISSAEIKQIAALIESKWPCDINKVDTDPMQWAQESYAIAKQQAYTFDFNKPIDKKYQQMTREVALQRVALAGCRLAALSVSYSKISYIPRV